jgi:hypothetical protein
MAENEQSKFRYDDFTAAVHPDPAKPEASVMMAGYVGHGAEGHVRIFPDATLNTWYDVPEADVIHSLPISDAKLGGSYVWVRASAAIKPGSAAAAAGAGATPVGGWPPSLGCQPSVMACPPAPGLGVPAQNTQATRGTECLPYPTQETCCTMMADCAQAGLGAPAGQAQTNPPTLGCSGGCNALGMAQTFTMGPLCTHAALVGTNFTNYFGCTAACAAPMAVQAQTNPPTLGCSGGCNALGMAQTFTMGPPCTHAALVGTQFTNYFGCTAACAAPALYPQGNMPPSGTMHQCCGVEQMGVGGQTFPPFTTRCLTMPPQCGVFNPFGR